MKKTIIYVIMDPKTNEVRYVGKTMQLLNSRKSSHRRTKEQNHRANGIRSIYARGEEPLYEVIDECYEDWADVERFWIAYFKFLGARLTNASIGGEGAPGVVWKEESKEKQRQSAKQPHRIAINRQNIKAAQESNVGRKQSEEWVNNRKKHLVGNQWNVGRKQSEEWIRNAHAPLIGRTRTEQECYALSVGSKHKAALTDEQVVEILHMHFIAKYPIGTLAKKFGVMHQVIKRIINLDSYMWLEHELRCPLTREYYIKGCAFDMPMYKRAGHPHSQETRERLSKAHTGKKVSDETKRKLSESHKGNTPGNKGMKWSKEQVEASRALSMDQVHTIRFEYVELKTLQRILAARYNVSTNTIHRVLHHQHPYEE